MQRVGIDNGGAVSPKQSCPHVFTACHPAAGDFETLRQCFSNTCLECSSSSSENWICLSCNKTLCSRYVAGHCESHFFETTCADASTSHCLVRRRQYCSKLSKLHLYLLIYLYCLLNPGIILSRLIGLVLYVQSVCET